MRVKFWGVRGSIPAPPSSDEVHARLVEALHRLGKEDRYLDLSDRATIEKWVSALPLSLRSLAGGNTPCVEVQIGDELLIFDLGTGLRMLGNELMQGAFGRGAGHAHLFLSHLHWDHIQGWPFFRPAYIAGNQFDFYARHECAFARLQEQQSAPFFPPEAWNDMAATFRPHVLTSEPVTLANNTIRVSTLELEHPSKSYAFRVETNDKVFVYASDGACNAPNGGGPDDPATPLIEFFRDADLIVFDAQFSLAESFEKRAWGHSSAILGVELAARAGATKLAMFHHDPNASDGHLEHLLRVSREYAAKPPAPCQPNAVDVFLAREGLEVNL